MCLCVSALIALYHAPFLSNYKLASFTFQVSFSDLPSGDANWPSRRPSARYRTHRRSKSGSSTVFRNPITPFAEEDSETSLPVEEQPPLDITPKDPKPNRIEIARVSIWLNLAMLNLHLEKRAKTDLQPNQASEFLLSPHLHFFSPFFNFLLLQASYLLSLWPTFNQHILHVCNAIIHTMVSSNTSLWHYDIF